MKTIILTLLASVAISGVAEQANAQQYVSPMPVITVCPPGQLLVNGTCVDRPHVGPGRTNSGIGDGSSYDMGCQWGAAPISSGLLCPGSGARQPRAR